MYLVFDVEQCIYLLSKKEWEKMYIYICIDFPKVLVIDIEEQEKWLHKFPLVYAMRCPSLLRIQLLIKQ